MHLGALAAATEVRMLAQPPAAAEAADGSPPAPAATATAATVTITVPPTGHCNFTRQNSKFSDKIYFT